MRLNRYDAALLNEIATDMDLSGAYYRFSILIAFYGKWTRNGVMPRSTATGGVTYTNAKAITEFRDPTDVFLLIDSLLVKYKQDPSYEVEFLAFDLYYLTSGKATNVRNTKIARLKRLLNSRPYFFLRDYERSYRSLVERLRVDIIESLKLQ